MSNKPNIDDTKTGLPLDSDNHSFRIAHLSDLHFGTQFNSGHWEYVEGLLLSTYKPDIVVVTGDLVDTPSFFSLVLAKKQLDELKENLGCPVISIPGNHDIGILGNLPIFPWNTMYRIVFFGGNEKIFRDMEERKKMPTFLEFSKIPKWEQWCVRFNYSLQFAQKFLSGSLKDPGPENSPILKPEFINKPFPIVLAGFDSNVKLFLATGRVDHRAILSLQKGLREMEDHSLCPRIALIHHHLVPIPYSNTKESPTVFEPFLVLRNAGTLLHNLLVFDFDLVLHGHKHYSNFARLSFDTYGNSAAEIAVISSASSTLDETSAGANSFNIIDILPNGLITYEPVFFGAGKTANSALATGPSTRKRLFSIESCKKRAHRKAIDRLNCEIELADRSLKIDEQGNAEFEFSVKGYRIFHGENICKPRFVLSVLRGALVPSSVRLNEESERQGHRLDIDRSRPPTKHIEIPIDLGHDTPDVEKGVSFGVKLTTVNNYLITNWEAKELESLEYCDFIGIPIRQPTQALSLRVSLPKEFDDPKPHVWVERLKDYPLLKFDNQRREVDIIKNHLKKKVWVYDFEMTQHESCNLEMITNDGQPESDNNVWALHVNNPMLGFCYSIRWVVNTANEDIDATVLSNAIQVRKTLIDLSQETLSPALQKIKTDGQEMLDKIFTHLLYPTFKSAYCHDEKMEASLLIYDNFSSDKKKKLLRVVFETGHGKALTGRCQSIPFYEGVAGAAFRSRTIKMYALPQLVGKEYESAYVYYCDNEKPAPGDEYTALISIPLYVGDYPKNHIISPKEVIGVFNLGTNARDSSLLKLIKQHSKTDQTSSGLGVALWFLALSYINGLANILSIKPENKKSKEPEQKSDDKKNNQYMFLEEREDGLFAPEKNANKKTPMTLTRSQRDRATHTISGWINNVEDPDIANKIRMFLSID
ncbi:MAG: metallophosphoesterase [Methylobacter tundripaludum]|nr:metallophosphoesterase [Methylobacter tundripaludum]